MLESAALIRVIAWITNLAEEAVYPSCGNRSGTRRRRSSCWRLVLTWGLAWIAVGQASVVAFLEWRHPEFLDPKYGCRMIALRALREEHKDHPLLLALGSSRAEQGFRPSLLANDPLFYNLARGGSSPLLYLLTLRRMLADGIRPNTLLVEIFPPALVEDEESAVIYKPTLRDLPLLRRYPISGRTWAFWLQDRLLLWYKYRSGFLAWAAPTWLPPQARWGEHLWDYRGGEWRAIGEYVSYQERRRLTDDAHRRYAHSLNHFRIVADADRALRELLDICRSQRIGVVLFLMPEAREFRGWYPSEARRQLSDYLTALRQEHGVPLIDARSWIEDYEFSDGHHLLSRGAAAFTRRFAGEVLSVLDCGTLVRQRRTP
ncbi:MAG: hypothetical protein ACRELG_01820 [Gemmataceae bacterium]